MSRVAGVTIPLFSIRTRADWGIGQITSLPACAAWIQRAGHRLLQLLPPYELAAGETSPYGARTSFGIDPTYVTLEAITDLDAAAIDDALGTEGKTTRERLRANRRVDYAAVRALKARVMHRAFERFLEREWREGTARAAELRAFITEERAWADDLALYVALRDKHGGYGWETWPAGERDRAPDAIDRAKEELEAPILEHLYGQWVLHGQWIEAKAAMHRMGVELMGDLPFIVGTESADVWASASQFRRDVSLGAPPDAFSEEGQDWGLPAYDWGAMDGNDLAWLRARTRRAVVLYDRFRLDHVVGYFRMFVRRKGEKGYFEPGGEDEQSARGVKVLSTMQSEAGAARVIGEDLGVIPNFVRAKLAELGIPGYRVMPWEKEWEKDGGKDYRDPKGYPLASVATWSTHDTAPIGAWWSELSAQDREGLGRLAMLAPDADEDARWLPLMRVLLGSSSELTLTLASELLGEHDRINLPGTVDASNWTYRLPRPLEDLESDPALCARMDRLRDAVRESGR